jgi:hypothetical protein
MSDPRGPLRISDLLGKPVIEVDSGNRLGQAWDVRIRRENKSASRPGDERWVATGLVITSRGALERFGFVHLRRFVGGEWVSGRSTIAWDRIERIGPEAIEVRSG